MEGILGEREVPRLSEQASTLLPLPENTSGAGPSWAGTQSVRTLVKKTPEESLPGTNQNSYLGWKWERMPNPKSPPNHPREGETLWRGSEVIRKGEMKDAK